MNNDFACCINLDGGRSYAYRGLTLEEAREMAVDEVARRERVIASIEIWRHVSEPFETEEYIETSFLGA